MLILVMTPDIIIDFGCADGAMLDRLHQIKPDVKLVGYDIDLDMLKQAKSRVGDKAILTNDWNQVLEILKEYNYPMVFLSSVIHEIYSYSHPKEVNKFWKKIFSGIFEWVVVRDMMPSVRSNKFIDEEDMEKVRQKAKPEVLQMFEEEWGPINQDYRNLIHFLLKYRYEENFDREMKENYVPVSFETVKKKIPSNYKIVYEDHYVLPFLQSEVRKDFGITIKEPTHVKLILHKQRD